MQKMMISGAQPSLVHRCNHPWIDTNRPMLLNRKKASHVITAFTLDLTFVSTGFVKLIIAAA